MTTMLGCTLSPRELKPGRGGDLAFLRASSTAAARHETDTPWRNAHVGGKLCCGILVGVLMSNQPVFADTIQTVPAADVTQYAQPLEKKEINKNEIWLVFVIGAAALFGATLVLENNEKLFPAIAKANKAMAISNRTAKIEEQVEDSRLQTSVEAGLAEARRTVVEEPTTQEIPKNLEIIESPTAEDIRKAQQKASAALWGLDPEMSSNDGAAGTLPRELENQAPMSEQGPPDFKAKKGPTNIDLEGPGSQNIPEDAKSGDTPKEQTLGELVPEVSKIESQPEDQEVQPVSETLASQELQEDAEASVKPYEKSEVRPALEDSEPQSQVETLEEAIVPDTSTSQVPKDAEIDVKPLAQKVEPETVDSPSQTQAEAIKGEVAQESSTSQDISKGAEATVKSEDSQKVDAVLQGAASLEIIEDPEVVLKPEESKVEPTKSISKAEVAEERPMPGTTASMPKAVQSKTAKKL